MIARFEALLKEKMGLDGASIGSAAIERAVQRRVVACALDHLDPYWAQVNSSEEELQQLIETVVVPETWFFRDPAAFKTLAEVVVPQWLSTHSQGVFRVLSVPSSTGEEPYTMAMALLDGGIPAERFHIDAVDISRRVVEAARLGVYGKNSFRGRDLEFRDRHFETLKTGWRLHERVRRQVEFRQGNLLGTGFAPEGRVYDAVFCRNLLIYFDRPTQSQAVAALERVLHAQGWFFVGPSESGLLHSHAFTSAKIPLAFAFRREAEMPRRSMPNLESRVRPQPVWRSRPVSKPKAQPFSRASNSPVKLDAKAASEGSGGDDIGRALQLADRGRLAEAMALCEAHVRKAGATAQACYVMGLVRDAEGGQQEAVTFYRKAIYLDPNHGEAMRQLGTLLESQGRTADARILNERASRLAEKLNR